MFREAHLSSDATRDNTDFTVIINDVELPSSFVNAIRYTLQEC